MLDMNCVSKNGSYNSVRGSLFFAHKERHAYARLSVCRISHFLGPSDSVVAGSERFESIGVQGKNLSLSRI